MMEKKKKGKRLCWSVYVIATNDGFLYAGITTDVNRRFKEHLAQGPKAARYLKAHTPEKIVFHKRVGSRSLASKVEYHFKKLAKRRKEQIIATGKLIFCRATGKVCE